MIINEIECSENMAILPNMKANVFINNNYGYFIYFKCVTEGNEKEVIEVREMS